LGDFEVFFFPAALVLFFGLGDADEEFERVFEPDFAFGFGEAEVFFTFLAFGLGEAEVFLAGDVDVSFFSVFFFREGLVFDRPRLAGDFDLAGLPLFVVPTVPAFFEFFVCLLGDFAERPLLAGDFERLSSPINCLRCSRPSSVSLYEARTFSIMFFSSALLKPSLSCLLNMSSSGTSKLAIMYLQRAWEEEPFRSRSAVSALIIITSYLG